MCKKIPKLELVRARQKISPHDKNQPWGSSSFFNQFCTYKHIYTHTHIYTIKTQLKFVFICTELIEETGRPPGVILACRGIFGLARESSSFGKNPHI